MAFFRLKEMFHHAANPATFKHAYDIMMLIQKGQGLHSDIASVSLIFSFLGAAASSFMFLLDLYAPLHLGVQAACPV